MSESKISGTLCDGCDYQIRRIDLGICPECGTQLWGDPVTYALSCSGNHKVHIGVDFCGRRNCAELIWYTYYSITVDNASHEKILALKTLCDKSCGELFRTIRAGKPLFNGLYLGQLNPYCEALNALSLTYRIDPVLPNLPNISVCYPHLDLSSISFDS